MSFAEEPGYLQELFEQAPGFMCFLRGPELRFEQANAAYRKLVGRDDLVGRALFDALPEVADQGYAELLARVIASGQPYIGHAARVLLERTAGQGLEEAFVDFIYQPVRDAAGAVVGVLVQGNGVTEAQRARIKREAAEQRYRALFEAIDDGFCLMQLLFDESGKAVDYRFLEANAAFEEHTGLRDVVGRTARELVPDLDPSWFQLYGSVALTGEALRFENHAPAMKRWFEVYASRVGDPHQRQVALVFKNVTAHGGLSNARAQTRGAAGAAGRRGLASQPHHTGSGLRRSAGRSGAVQTCFGCARCHALEVRKTSGTGKMTWRLDCIRKLMGNARRASHQTKKILVVEDNEDLRELMCGALRRDGYVVAEAQNGREALEAMDGMQEPPCLVLLDLMMPVMTGAELLERLRDTGKLGALPVIVLSAIADRQQPQGASAYLKKPVAEDVLLQFVHEYC